jgi:glycosyltransferase involved in cell wall biosynthesis
MISNPSSGRRVWTINGRFTVQQITGVQRYAREIVSAMDQILLEDEEVSKRLGLVLAAPPKADVSLDLSRIPTRHSRFGSGHAWDQFVLPWYENFGVLSLGNFGPVLSRRHVVCIHDANTFLEPASYSRMFRTVYRTMLPLVGRRARKVATVSQFSADMLSRYGICRAEKIFIAPNGHEHALRWDPARSAISDLRPKHRPYVLLLGSRAKHKNVQVVLDAAKTLQEAGIDLVVCGGMSSIFSESTPEAVGDNVHYAGYVSDDDLAALYGGALCLAFPSKTEGFGIPILEAMARLCPVVSSNAASLTEVGGDAVVSLDPEKSKDWSSAIIALRNNPDLRSSLIERGRKRAALFSWKRSARLYLEEMLRLAE